MLVAAVLDEKETILPIVEGSILRIYNTKSRRQQDFINPAFGIKKGRRLKTLRFAEEKGAIIFVAPPNTFCQLSYEAAKKDKVKFFNIAASTNFQIFKNLMLDDKVIVQTFLPEDEILSNQVLV